MDEIMGQPMRTPIKVKDFLNNYKTLLKAPYLSPSCDEINIQDVMKLSNDNVRFEAIRESCNLNNLKQSNDPRVSDFIPGVTELSRKTTEVLDMKSIKLKSFDFLVKHKQYKKPTPFRRIRESSTLMKLPLKEETGSYTIQPGEEVIIYVRFYRPTRATHIGRTLEKPVFCQEFACLGRNFLSELRDKVFCTCNDKKFYDISDNPDAPLPLKDNDPAFFFITDTFYNDKRNPSNPDYSKTIRRWAKTAKGLDHLQFKVARLEETRLIDLTVSLGFPQLYQHHGNCEHVFVFSNIEVITNPSTQLFSPISGYPFVLAISRNHWRSCNICGKWNYVFVVEDSNRQLLDPAYLCKLCFKSYHYIDGKKIGEFSAYRLNDELETAEDNNFEEGSDEVREEYTNEKVINDEINDNSSENSEEIDIIIKEETVCNIEDN